MTEVEWEPGDQETLSPGEYARRIETYLCRKNDGHLVRVVGPAFVRVCRWAEQGIPLAVAFRGIDRRFERYYATSKHRRPLRVEFCEADVLDAFDAWRRAVGVRAVLVAQDTESSTGAGEALRAERTVSLPAHLDRLQLRLTALLTTTRMPEALRDFLDATVHELERVKQSARAFRGQTRNTAIEALRVLDARLIDVAVASADPATLGEAEQEAAEQLRPFEGRLDADTWREAVDRAARQALREKLGLPTLPIE